jgi:hypothetical protein
MDVESRVADCDNVNVTVCQPGFTRFRGTKIKRSGDECAKIDRNYPYAILREVQPDPLNLTIFGI